MQFRIAVVIASLAALVAANPVPELKERVSIGCPVYKFHCDIACVITEPAPPLPAGACNATVHCPVGYLCCQPACGCNKVCTKPVINS
ncbi:hypothetical protein TWF694_006417 [Orbilia ellipsospora]|uniref:Uncharacterized protein n=1 Tax=Orbilia ellipsospora TaxID=2528407 RepID=A0AAV9XRS4_9PEZI